MKNLEDLTLAHGPHENPEQGLCAMEAVAWLAGEPHSDRPECACPVLTEYMIGLNDRLREDERQLLKPYLMRIIGTRDGNEVKRAEVLAMRAVTRVVPIAIEFAGLKAEASAMRSATDLESASRAADAASNAAYAAYASGATRDAAVAADAAYVTHVDGDAAAAAAYAANTDESLRAEVIKEALGALEKALKV